MTIQEAQDQAAWDGFLGSQEFSPFLQSWTMGEVYREIGEEPIRLEVRDGDAIKGICQAIVVPARRGKHLAVLYGPVLDWKSSSALGVIDKILIELDRIGKEKGCLFIRMSPFLTLTHDAKEQSDSGWSLLFPDYDLILKKNIKGSPLHLLAEHIWYLDIKGKTEEELMKNMRQNTRNLVRRAGREGVEVTASNDPMNDIDHFLKLHEETRKRHHFTPYTDEFFRAQLKRFSDRGECTLYLARYNDEVIASSIHMHAHDETSYHHGASTHKYPKIPASYLLQWTAITDSLKRGDNIYSFWGIAPDGAKKHPFAGVTLFKKGFGGEMLELVHCMDIPISKRYYLTRAFETYRKWRRGF